MNGSSLQNGTIDIRKEDYQDMGRICRTLQREHLGCDQKEDVMNPITRTLNVDNLLLLALQEDISSEDVTTNAVMPEACQERYSFSANRTACRYTEAFARVFTPFKRKPRLFRM